MTISPKVVPSQWSNLLGPFYGEDQVAKFLGGVSPQTIADRGAKRTLLGLKTADGVIVFPTFQFDDQNQVLPGLVEILEVFQNSAVDDWTLAGWLVAQSRSLDGRTVIEWLRAGKDREVATALARNFARD